MSSLRVSFLQNQMGDVPVLGGNHEAIDFADLAVGGIHLGAASTDA